MKLITTLLILISLSFCRELRCSNIIHKDPHDIKKLNVGLSAFYMHSEQFGLRPTLNYYPINRIMVNYTGFYGIPVFQSPADYGFINHPADDPFKFRQHEFNLDLHVLDVVKNKKVHVVLAKNSEYVVFEGNKKVVNYTEVESQVRRVLALNAGYFIRRNIEKIDKENLQVYDIANSKTIDAAVLPDDVYSNLNYRDLSVGIKYKVINATGINHDKYGKKYNDIHFELYTNIVLPVAYSYAENIYKRKETDPSYRLLDRTLKPGFRIGMNYRTAIKAQRTYSIEWGKLPSYGKLSGNSMFFNLSFGFNVNFGNIKEESGL